MPALEILRTSARLAGDGLGIERKDPVDDMIGASCRSG
jgi:hypothetical protein